LLNLFRTAQAHSGACKKKWNQAATDLCPCDEKQKMSHVVDSCPLSKLNDCLSQLHSADDEAVLGSSAAALDSPQKAEQEEEEEVSPAVWRCCGIQKTPIPLPMTPNSLVL